MGVNVDYQELIQRLRTRSDLTAISERRTTLAFTPLKKQTKVWQVTPLSEVLLRLCDGRRTIGDIAREFSPGAQGFAGIPPEQACLFGLKQLEKDGLVDFSPRPDCSEGDEEDFEIEPEPRRLPAAQATNTQQPWPPGNYAAGPSSMS
jgi:hypothetical protein